VSPADLLSPRELQILAMRERGLALKQIAGELGISLNTVKWHLRNILHKTKTLSSLAAIYRVRLSCRMAPARTLADCSAPAAPPPTPP